MLMLTLNYRYRIYPNTNQQFLLLDWMEICRKAYNYALLEIKDWCNSRKCLIDRCSLEKEYIIPADTPFPPETNQLNKLPKAKKQFPRLGEVPSQVQGVPGKADVRWRLGGCHCLIFRVH